MKKRLEILYETDSFSRDCPHEFLALSHAGERLYGRQEPAGIRLKIRTEPRHFVSFDLSDPSECRMLWFDTVSGLRIRKPEWETKNGELLIHPEKIRSFMKKHEKTEEDLPVTEEVLKGLSGLSHYSFSQGGFLVHRDVSGGDWGQDEIMGCFREGTFFLDEKEVLRITLRSHRNLDEQEKVLLPLLGGAHRKEEDYRAFVCGLDPYDSYLLLTMRDADKSLSCRNHRLDGGKEKEWESTASWIW